MPDEQRVPTWQVGQRVRRDDRKEQGTIIEANGTIKARWDGGGTSYFKRGKPGNVQLVPQASS